MPEAWRHFIHPALIWWFTSSSISMRWTLLEINIHVNSKFSSEGDWAWGGTV
jgi:hypothetical protein